MRSRREAKFPGAPLRVKVFSLFLNHGTNAAESLVSGHHSVSREKK